MIYIFKLSFVFYIVSGVVTKESVRFEEIMLFLLITALDIYRFKYNNALWMIGIEGILIGAASMLSPVYTVLFGIIAYELVRKKILFGLLSIIGVGIYLAGEGDRMDFLLILILCVVYGYISHQLEEKERLFLNTYDRERQYRYQLEETKQKLLDSTKEAVHMAEIKERNRIAREIHDNVGHSIAGILMQLQASQKLFDRDAAKASVLLKNSIEGLSESLTLLRNTVHNIKPRETLGAEYIKSLIEKFTFCEIDFRHSGDLNSVSPEKMEILCTNIKEALTNAAKYSKATRVDINIECNQRYIRLFIKDNGVGCSKVKEGLGLSGMKERVQNLGGTVSVSSEDGFLIVCLIPNSREGGGMFESSHRR